MMLAGILVTLYFVMLLAFGPWAAKKMNTGSTNDFILAGRNVPLIIVIGGIIATLINSATILGYAGSGYSLGISAYFSAMGWMIALTWMGFWFIPRLRKAKITTIPELFEKYFGLPHRVVTVVLVACRDMGVTAGTVIGMAVVFQGLFDITLNMALVITLAVTLIFTTLGGMWAVMITDALQAALILVGTLILVPLAIAYIGGWESFIDKIPTTHISMTNAGFSQSTAWIIMAFLTALGYQTLIQRGLSAKSEKVAKKGFLYGGIIATFWYMVPFLIGTIAFVIFPGIDPEESFTKVASLFGKIGSILFSIVILASCISTLSSTVLTTASNISLDIYQRIINKNASGKELVIVTRISIVMVALLGTFIAKSLPYILELMLVGGRIMAASLTPVLLAIVFWKPSRTAYISSFLAMVAGSLVIVITLLTGSGQSEGVVMLWKIDPMLIGLPVTLLVLIIGTIIENKFKQKPENINIVKESL